MTLDDAVELAVFLCLIVLFAAFLFWGAALILVGLSGGKLP